MILGSEGRIPNYVAESGFEVVNSVKILGISITRNFADLSQNFTKTEEKISNIVRFWQHFNFSIIGRLNSKNVNAIANWLFRIHSHAGSGTTKKSIANHK
jgi:hypothetical protein